MMSYLRPQVKMIYHTDNIRLSRGQLFSAPSDVMQMVVQEASSTASTAALLQRLQRLLLLLPRRVENVRSDLRLSSRSTSLLRRP